jgi:hypothetical protein
LTTSRLHPRLYLHHGYEVPQPHSPTSTVAQSYGSLGIPGTNFNSRGCPAAQRNTCHRLWLLHSAGATSRAHCLAWQGLTLSPEATSPVAPTRASPSPPASSNGPYDLDERANGQPQAPQTVSAKNPKAAAAMANDMNIVRRKLTGYVGFANLPNQWHRKSVRKGFNFNVMVVGTYPCQPARWQCTNATLQASLVLESLP